MTRPAGTAPAGLLLVLGGCAGEVTTGPVEEPTPTCLEAEAHSDLPWIEDNVLATGCAAFASCHKDGAPSAGGLDLGRGMAMANLVDVPSALEPSMDLVEPGSPEDSYLLVILGHYGADDPRIDPAVGTMPANNALLCAEKRDAIERWIAELGGA